MKKIFLVVLIALFLIVVSFVLYMRGNVVPINNVVVENTSGIQVNSPSPDALIASPLKIIGVVSGNGWNGFEGQVGTVTLKDSKGNELAKGPLIATTEWTQLPTSFETTLEFTSPGAESGELVFHNENASGDLSKDKIFIFPVKFN